MSDRARIVPGVVIDYLDAESRCYVGSPSIAALPDGAYLATHDIFGPSSTHNVTRLFRSDDRGRSWVHLCDLEGLFWASLFVHHEELYLMGSSERFGHIVIRRSSDAGRSWTKPVGPDSGLLRSDGAYHTAPVPVIEHDERVWRAFEDLYPGRVWGRDFRAFMLSASAGSDLLSAHNWTASKRIAGAPEWLGGSFGGWLEGNAVVGKDGKVKDLLRVDFRTGEEMAAMVEISEDGREASFDPHTGFLEFPGGCKKFTIRYDSSSGLYWSLVNWVPERFRAFNRERARNTLALISSADLRDWKLERIVLQHEDPERHAFQYADWIFDGEDIALVSRTAFDDAGGGAHNQHDANYLTFHRIEGFRYRQ